MKERSFLDTNILVYTDDGESPVKRESAIQLLELGLLSRQGVISTQVLQEYFAASTRKLGVDIELAKQRTRLFSRLMVVQIAPEDVLAAIDLMQLHRLSFWDALIVHAALRTECSVLYSEDMQDGRVIDGLKILNPFSQ